MKKAQREADELRPEYKRSDFGKLVRSKYVERIKQSSNVVVLDPDIAATFPSDKIVNDTLRQLLVLAKSSTGSKKLPSLGTAPRPERAAPPLPAVPHPSVRAGGCPRPSKAV